MKKMLITTLIFAAGTAWGQENAATDDVDSTDVDLRVSVLEVIDVTADKTTEAAAQTPDPEVDAILDEIDALDEDETGE